MRKYGIQCEPFLPETKQLIQRVVNPRPKRCQPAVQVVFSEPPLAFDERGNLDENLALKAARDGIEVGSVVVVVKRKQIRSLLQVPEPTAEENPTKKARVDRVT